MNAAMEMIGKKDKDKEVVPAAMLYYHVADPMIREEDAALSEEMLNAKIRESLRMTGIVNESEDVIKRLDGAFGSRSEVIPVERKKDGSLGSRSGTLNREELQTISRYVTHKITHLGKRILQGDIGKKPYTYGGNMGCDYCVYRSVCGFSERIPGYETEKLDCLTKEEAIARMQREGGA